ncbi:MAG: WYL domain-containing protein [Planctomycetota bacterium]
MSAQSQQERLLNLLALLLHSDRPVPFHLIYHQLEGYAGLEIISARRSFTRDIHTMRELGVPVFYVEHLDPQSSGYEIPKEYYYLPKIELNESERALLSQIYSLTDKSMKSPLFRALHKMNYDQFQTEMEESSLGVAAERSDPLLSKISSFIAYGKTIRFDYQGIQSEQGTPRTLDPYGLGYYNHHWYLVGYCHRRQDIRCFKVARIQGKLTQLTKRVERDFKIPENFNIKKYIGTLASPPTQEPFTAKIRFDAKIAWMVQDQFSEPLCHLQEDGSLLLELRELNDPKLLFRLVAPYFHLAKILEPSWLIRDFYKLLKETYLENQTKGG